jgi:uncharacterized protein (TIGR03067 family)
MFPRGGFVKTIRFRTIRICAASVIAAASIALSAQGGPAAALQGTWVVIGQNGHDLPPALHVGLTISGNKYQGMEGGKLTESGTVTFDDTKKPATLDFAIEQGGDAGKKQLSLVEVSGDTMKVALGDPGTGVRPSSMATNTLTLARIKPLPKDFEGRWEGAVDANGKSLRLAVKLSNGADGLASGTLVSIDQGNSEVPIAAVLVRGQRLTLILPAIGGGIDGTLTNGQINSTFSQSGAALQLILKKSE